MMKKILSIALALAMILSLTACGTNSFSSVLDDNGHFKGITASDYFTFTDVDDISITQANIDAEIEYLVTNMFPDDDPVYYTEGVVEEDSNVNMDYVGKIDGVEFDGGSTNGAGTEVNIATTSYIPGFLNQLVGHKVGETFDINVTFPDPYENNTDLSGKAAVFTITINSLVEHHYSKAEFNDDFVKNNLYSLMYSYYGVTLTTAEDYIEFIKESDLSNKLSSAVVWKEDAELPEELVTWMETITLANLKTYAASNYGIELITYLKKYEEVETKEEYLEKNIEDIKSDLKTLIMNQALAEYFEIEITDEDLDAYFDGTSAKDIKEVEKEYGKPYLTQYILNEQIYTRILEKVFVE